MTAEAPPRLPDHDDLEALIEEARQRARGRRRRNGAAALIAALLIVGGYLLAAQAGGDRAASRAAIGRSSSVPLRVGAGPFWYTRTVGTMRASRCAKPLPGVMNPCGSTVWFDVVMSTETWVGTDGTMRERSVEVSQRFASPADRARWVASRRPGPVPTDDAQGDALDIAPGHFPSSLFGQLDADVPPLEGPPSGAGPIDVGDGLFTYRQLLALPTGGRAALARIDQARAELRHRYARMLLRWHSPGAALIAHADLAPIPNAGRAIQELLLIAHLDTAPVPTRVRLGLLHAATALPGVTIAPHAGTGVTLSAAAPHWQPVSFTFDPRTGELLTGPPMDAGAADVAGPDSTVVAQGPVDSITALPDRVKPIRGLSAPPLWPSPPSPTIETVQPAIAGPQTMFTIQLAGVSGQRPESAPTAWLGITGSAGNGIYRGPNEAYDPCLPPTSLRVWPTKTIHRAGELVYVYRVGPERFHLRTWCPGRYSIGLDTLPNPLPPHYTTPPYTGPSGTSTYIEVR